MKPNTNIKTFLSKKGVSPVVATIVLVAVALVAAVSVGGFVTGLFGGFSSSITMNSATYVAGSTPVLSFSLGNSGNAVNVTTVIITGPGISGVYTYTASGPGQANQTAGNGASSFTLDSSSSPVFNPGTGTSTGNAYSIVINLSNGRSVTQETIAK